MSDRRIPREGALRVRLLAGAALIACLPALPTLAQEAGAASQTQAPASAATPPAAETAISGNGESIRICTRSHPVSTVMNEGFVAKKTHSIAKQKTAAPADTIQSAPQAGPFGTAWKRGIHRLKKELFIYIDLFIDFHAPCQSSPTRRQCPKCLAGLSF